MSDLMTSTREPRLPFALPDIGQEEIDEVVDSLRTGWITTGPKARKFERQFADFIGGGVEAVSVNSATAGMHLALEALGVRKGGKVITSPYTFTATAEVARYLDADPLFVDIDPRTMNIDPERVITAIQNSFDVECIVPVHIAGQACDMAPLLEAAQQKGIPVMEDAAHAFPASYRGRSIGTLSNATVFSFYATKTITTGEGGMVVSADHELVERVRTMRLHGISRDVFDRYAASRPSWYYEVVAPGFKYNMPDLAAAIGIHQLAKAEAFHRRRRAIAEQYNRDLRDLPLATPSIARSSDAHAWHLYIIQLELERLRIDRNRFIELMADRGIGTSVHFIPLHLQPYWRDRYQLRPDSFPNAYRVYQRAVSLPIYTRMSDYDVSRVIDSVKEICLGNER